MALETLLNVKEIGGYGVYNKADIPISETAEWHQNYENSHPILINHDDNTIAFKIQNQPIKEVGVNGCQVDTLIHAAKMIIEGLNAKFPCRENAVAITKLDEALMWLEKRTKDRKARGVEGTSQA